MGRLVLLYITLIIKLLKKKRSHGKKIKLNQIEYFLFVFFKLILGEIIIIIIVLFIIDIN